MPDKWKDDPQDEPITGTANDDMRGVGDDDEEFDATDDLDEDDAEDEEEGSTF
jgi:hypothetical protein